MEPFSPETLTILVLVAVVLAGVSFTAISILVIYLLCSNGRRTTTVNPTDTRSMRSSVYIDSRSSSASSSASSIISPTPLKTSTNQQKRPAQQSSLQKSRSDSISVIEEHPFSSHSNQKKQQQQAYKHDETTTIRESRTYDQRRLQQKPFKPTTDGRFIDRHTPYPPEVIARERLMMNHIRFPRANRLDEE